jgi:hypothetical protein
MYKKSQMLETALNFWSISCFFQKTKNRMTGSGEVNLLFATTLAGDILGDSYAGKRKLHETSKQYRFE